MRSQTTRVKPEQAKKLLNVLNPLKKQPKLNQEQAKAGIKKVQTKLMLPEPAYLALKRAAAASNETMSGLVAQLAEGLARTGTR